MSARWSDVAPGTVTAFDAVREAVIIRNPQPDDVLILTVPVDTTIDTARTIRDQAKSVFVCKVIVMSEVVQVALVGGGPDD